MALALNAERLGKSYRIRHAHNARYDSLREAIAGGVKRLGRRILGRGARSRTSETFWALKDVSFEVEQGERLGIIGRNGAGKSTLLKILSRVTEPTKGRAVINGRFCGLLEVGTGFHPELTGRDNVYMSGAILGMKRQEIARKFDEIVAFAEVEQFIDTPVKHYSSGMYVRLGFAVLAHMDPDILIVDEVLAVGDVRFQKKCMGKMEDVGQHGRTVIFVSHNMAAVRRLCDRCLLLESGTLRMIGPTHQAIAEYTGDADFVGCRIWSGEDRPGNWCVRVDRVSVKDREGQPTTQVLISEGAIVEIEYTILSEGQRLALSMVLHDPEDSNIFSSLSNIGTRLLRGCAEPRELSDHVLDPR